MSETDTCRERLAKFCVGTVLEIGHGGGRPIVDHAICLDRAIDDPRRAACGEHPTHLVGDAFGTLPFKDGVMDTVYSSHVLEDSFDPQDALLEWLRVLKVGGRMVLFLPDQRTYEKCCFAHDQEPNHAHVYCDFGLEFVKARLPAGVKIIHELFPVPGNPYSFDLVIEKL